MQSIAGGHATDIVSCVKDSFHDHVRMLGKRTQRLCKGIRRIWTV
uniref:Uncharacterized protein n=1 Tax=Arundo donax TaxID=35708 RepID=A0A0A8Y220_ARUDO